MKVYSRFIIIVISLIFQPINYSFAQGRLDRPTFFRDGQMLMDQEIQRLQQEQQQPSTPIEHPSQLLTIDQGQLIWQKYLFRDGGFSVWMPQGIQSQETVKLNLGTSELSFEVFATQPQIYRFVAAYSEPLHPTQLADTNQLLLSIKNGIIQHTKFTLLTENNITWQQYSGKELTMKQNNELISFHLYLINQRIYILAAGQKNTETISTNILSFFDSFRLLN
jgi:hypothetical protein